MKLWVTEDEPVQSSQSGFVQPGSQNTAVIRWEILVRQFPPINTPFSSYIFMLYNQRLFYDRKLKPLYI